MQSFVRFSIFVLFVVSILKVEAQNKLDIDLDNRLKEVEVLSRSNPDSALLLSSNLLNQSKNSTNNEAIYHCLISNGSINGKLNNYDEAIEHYQQAYKIALLIGNVSYQAQSQNKIGSARYDWSIYDLSLENFNTALKLAKDNNLLKEESIALNYIGLVHYQNGNFDESMKYLNQSLKIKEEVHDSAGIASIFNTIGVINYSLKNFDKAIEYFSNSMSVKERMGDFAGMSNNMLHVGNIYAGKGELDSAISYYEKSHIISKEIGHPKLQSIALGNIGEIYSMKGEYEQALVYLNQAQEIKESIGDKKRIVYGLNALGDFFFNQNDYSTAEKYYVRSLGISDSSGLREPLLDCYLKLAELNYRVNKKDKSVQYYQRYIAMNDSVFGIRSNELVNELQTKYESEKKQARIDLLEQESKIRELKQQRSKYTSIFLAVLSFLLIALAALLYSRYKLKNRTSIELSSKNIELSELNATKDKFYSIIAHDIRSPLNAFHHLSESLSSNYSDFNADMQKEMLEDMKQSSRSLVGLFENLLEWTKSQTARIKIKNEDIIVDQLFQTLQSEIHEFAIQNQVEIEIKPASFQLISDRNMIRTILRNLTINAIKFSEAKSKVVIVAEQDQTHTTFKVIDSGQGISKEDQKRLFKIDEDISLIGDTKHKGAGLGLLICKEFVDKLNGNIGIDSQVGLGTTIWFNIPKTHA